MSSLQGKPHARVKHILEAPDMDTGRKLLDEAATEFERLAPKVIERLEAGLKMNGNNGASRMHQAKVTYYKRRRAV